MMTKEAAAVTPIDGEDDHVPSKLDEVAARKIVNAWLTGAQPAEARHQADLERIQMFDQRVGAARQQLLSLSSQIDQVKMEQMKAVGARDALVDVLALTLAG